MDKVEDEDDDPQPEAYSTLYDPWRGIRERLVGRFNWWQRALLVAGAWVVVVAVLVVFILLRINH
jgi:hypothetical protein